MITDNRKLRIELDIDKNNQWFATLYVQLGGVYRSVQFKIDTGCNALVLSHKTLKRLGFTVDKKSLAALPDMPGKLASGETSTFKKLGGVALFQDIKRAIPVCNANAICHATRQTNDLLGTEVLYQFIDVNFKLRNERYLELVK